MSLFNPLSWLRNLALGGLGDVLRPVTEWLGKREDTKVSSRRIDARVAEKWLSAALKEREIETSLMLAMMKHKAWWIAWGLIVFPVGLYHAAIFFVSIFDMFLNSPDCGKALRRACDWYIKRVPPEQEKLARDAVAFVLTAHVGSGIVGGGLQVLDRFLRGKP